MIQNFPFSNGIMSAEVVNAPNEYFFFVRNGEPRHIMCHILQGGRLDVTSNGRLVVIKEGQICPPCKGDKVVLIRESNDPNNRLYTKAMVWVREVEWDNAKWAVNIDNTYRAVGFNHRMNGQFTPTSSTDVELISGTLREIIGKDTRNIGDRFMSRVGNKVFSCEVRWERLAGDTWVECLDPRPKEKK